MSLFAAVEINRYLCPVLSKESIMHKLPTIIIHFDNEIDPRAIPFFRGAVIASLEKKPKIRTTSFIFPKSMTIGDTLSWHRS